MFKKIKFELCGKLFHKKKLTTHIERVHHQNEFNFNVLEKPEIGNVNFNNNSNKRTLVVGPSFLGKNYLMFKILSRMSNRYLYVITKSPPEQYSNSKIKIKGIGE